MKFRKKPVVIDAIQFNGRNVGEIEVFVGKKLETRVFSDAAYEAGVAAPLFEIDIETLEGVMTASPNDYIIKGVWVSSTPANPMCLNRPTRKRYENNPNLRTVRYCLIPRPCPIIVNWNLGSTVSEQICENEIGSVTVNTFKCLVSGDISLSWNTNNIIEL